MARIAYRIQALGPVFTIRDLRGQFDREITAALLELGALGQRLVVDGAPAGVASGGGGFRGSVFTELRGRPAERSQIIGSPLVYGPVLEVGRRPGKRPPFQPILLWVRRKLGLQGHLASQAAFLVARKIGARGYPGRFMFQRAAAALEPIARARFQTLAAAMIHRLGGR
jgi:hypothetical protein